MSRMRPILAVLAWVLLSGAASAAVSPTPGQEDPRIRTVTYDPNQVVLLQGHLGYAITVEFAADEKIEKNRLTMEDWWWLAAALFAEDLGCAHGSTISPGF